MNELTLLYVHSILFQWPPSCYLSHGQSQWRQKLAQIWPSNMYGQGHVRMYCLEQRILFSKCQSFASSTTPFYRLHILETSKKNHARNQTIKNKTVAASLKMEFSSPSTLSKDPAVLTILVDGESRRPNDCKIMLDIFCIGTKRSFQS